jgi:nitroreductase
MSATVIDQRTIRDALRLANHAPSVHNTQPWHWYTGNDRVHLYADLQRWLPATDPQGRDMVISCGAALHHARVALAAMNIPTRIHRQPNPEEPDHLASLELRVGRCPDTDLALASAIPLRHSDRRPFSNWPVPAAFLEELVTTAAGQGAIARIVEQRLLPELLTAIAQAEQQQHNTPGYDTELALWSGHRVGNDGIPAASLLTETAHAHHAARRFTPGQLTARTTGDNSGEGSQLLILGAASDDTLSQLRVGEALSAVLLHAIELGLASCPLSQPFEVPETRRLVGDLAVSESMVPQLIVRIGWSHGPALRPTPRRAVEDTMSRLPF